MGWNWRSRSRLRLLEAMQEELARVRSEMDASLADAVAVVEGRMHKDLEQRAETTTELAARVDRACASIDSHELELLHALARVADACDTIALRVEMDSQDRKALIAALESVATSLTGDGQAALAPTARDRVTGGTVDARPSIDLTSEDLDTPSGGHPWGRGRR